MEIPVKDQKGKNLVVARSPGSSRVEVQELARGLMDKFSLVFGWKKGGTCWKSSQKDGTRLVVAMDGINLSILSNWTDL